MLLVKYTKLKNARFIPHVDMLRQTARILRRAGIKVKFSQGFNPHELIFFAPPIPLCMGSTAEYCVISTDEGKEDFIGKFNARSIDGIAVEDAVEVDKNPNIAGKAIKAKYRFPAAEDTFLRIKKAFEADTYEITFTQKGEEIKKEVRSFMYEVGEDGDGYYVVLAHGNDNLRADRFLGDFGIKTVDIVKTEEYILEDGREISCDDLFAK